MCDLKEYECMYFKGNLPHSSVMNKSKTPSYALIARVYDYRADVTLSDKTSIKSYLGSDGGYPGLKID